MAKISKYALIEGQMVNKFKFIRYAGKDKHGARLGVFECSCGKEVVMPPYRIAAGHVDSCGCRHKNYPKIGDVVNGFELVRFPEEKIIGRAAFYKCFCGVEFWARCHVIENGDSKGCGCKFKSTGIPKKGERKRTGIERGHEYKSWTSAKDRCFNPNCKAYPEYGQRGVSMFLPWAESFEVFIDYIGRSPSPKHTLDRFPDNDGNYEPGNVRWATKKEQSNNRRSNVNLVIGGVRKTATEWAEIYNMPPRVVLKRLRLKWDGIDALTTPIQNRNKR